LLATDIDQIALDTLAAELYPKGSAATRNRQVYTPVSAVLKHVGIEKKFRRPRGSQGNKSTSWLEPDQAFAGLDAADAIDLEFGLLCEILLYTGMRLDEALTRHLRHLRLDRAFLYLTDSKTGEPRGCHLPPELVLRFQAQPPRKSVPVVRDEHGHFLTGKPLEDAGVPFLERHPDAKLFSLPRWRCSTRHAQASATERRAILPAPAGRVPFVLPYLRLVDARLRQARSPRPHPHRPLGRPGFR